jgi:dTDP-4-amino-4,6-dideoxygalactose transaminase
MSAIPFVNLDRQYQALRGEIGEAIQRVLDSKAFIQGPFVDEFERSFAGFCGSRHAIGCANGTAAITLALEAAEVGSGDEVITTTHTFAATASAIWSAGATPVFVDIEREAYTIDVAAVRGAITSRTKAIIPVHIYGTPCDMPALVDLASHHNLLIIEDAAQAHGASIAGTGVGNFGIAATYSFYPGKNLGAYGDAGAVVTNDDGMAKRLRKLRNHGRSSKYLHDMIGSNQRMDGLQGAILSVKLPHLAQWNHRRRELAARYDAALAPLQFKIIQPPADAVSVYHLYIVEVSNRDDVQADLAAVGIETGVHYPVPLHRQPAFAAFSGRQSLPMSETISGRILSLPICADLAEGEQDRVIEHFLKVAQS